MAAPLVPDTNPGDDATALYRGRLLEDLHALSRWAAEVRATIQARQDRIAKSGATVHLPKDRLPGLPELRVFPLSDERFQSVRGLEDIVRRANRRRDWNTTVVGSFVLEVRAAERELMGALTELAEREGLAWRP